jgi:SM-20-related protein
MRSRSMAGAASPPPASGARAEPARRAEARGDRVRWIDAASESDDEHTLGEALDTVRRDGQPVVRARRIRSRDALRALPAGRGLRPSSRPPFRDDDARVLSCVFYLNDAWGEHDGGALRLHLDDGPRDVAPVGGTLVAFLADRVEHEVLPAMRDRLAVAGWFRRRR